MKNYSRSFPFPWRYFLLICFLLVPFIVPNIYYLHLINISLISVILVVGLNLFTGYTGQISIGHAAFFGAGAYVSGILTLQWGLSFWLALPLAGIFAALLGYMVGRPTLRLKGAYLAIASIGIGEITQLVLINWTSVTGGAGGIKGIKAPQLFGFSLNSNQQYFYLLAFVTILVYFFSNRLTDSELGRAFRAIREEETAAQFMGIDSSRLKVLAFVISTFLAGIAGSLFAHLEGYLSPYGFGFTQSVGFLIMILAGGLGYKWGPVVGVFTLTFSREYIRVFNDYQLVIYGALLIFIIVFMPKGISGYLYQFLDKWQERKVKAHARDHSKG